MEVYSLYIDDGDYEVVFTLEELYKKSLRCLSIRDIDLKDHLFGFKHWPDGTKEKVIYNGTLFNSKELSEEEIKEIEIYVDKRIEEGEATLKKMGGVALSGLFLPCRSDREKYLKSEKLVKSHWPKTFEELDQSAFEYV